MVPQHADLSSQTISGRGDQNAYLAASTPARTDMAELSQKHGFPASEHLLPPAQSSGDAAPAKPDVSSPMATAGADTPPETHAAAKPDAAPAPAKEEGGSHEVYDRPVVSTIGNDTKVAVDVAPTQVPGETPSTESASPVDAVDARAAAPVPSHSFDATPPSSAQTETPRIAPPPARTDIG